MYIDTTNAESGRIVLNAAHADSATVASKLDSNAGSSTLPVYFSGGVPVATGTSLAVSVTGNAATATKLKTARTIGITDDSGEHAGTSISFNGSANKTLKLPATIGADIIGNVTGNVTGNATSADKLTVADTGSATVPTYFSGGVPTACTSLSLNTTGSAAKWTTARNITISDDDATNSGDPVALDGSSAVTLKLPSTIKATLSGNASSATTAASADKLSVNAGDSNTPVYFTGGVPTVCTSLDLNTTGSAAKWTTARAFKITDSDATNSGASVNVDGSAAVTLKLPSTIKASLSGKATSAGTADSADKLSVNAGSSTLPIYFSGGVPVATGTSLAVNITKNAATATKLATARALAITDADGTNEGTGFDFDGSAGGTFVLPATIKANITGNITGNAASADKLTVNGGDSNTPVYFTAGVPTPCTGLDLDTSGNAATATKWKNARNFYVSDSDGTNTGIATSVNGTANATIKLPAIIKATLSGKATSAGTADKLASDAGDSNTPVYFSGGVPTPCTALDLNTTGSAAKWTTARAFKISDADATNTSTGVNVDGSEAVTLKLPTTIKADLTGNADSATNAAAANKLNSNAGSATVPVYFDGGIPNACTSLSLNTTGSAATLTTARNLTIMDYSLTYEGGKQPFDGSTDVILEMPSEFEGTLHGNADSATKLTTATAGDANTPVYFTGGKPVACTSLDLNTSGNAATATKLATARTISLTGDVTGSGSFDGSGNLSIATTVADDSHNHTKLSDGGKFTTTAECDDILSKGKGLYYNCTSHSGTSIGNDGIVISGVWSNTYGAQIWLDDGSGAAQMRVRNRTPSAWNDWRKVWMEGDSVTGAVWNDYAECRESDCYEAGYVLSENGDDTLSKSNERLAPFAGVSSDTWGFSQGETERAKTHIAVAGRVLVYPYQNRNNYKPGDCVCAAPGGTVDIMTREEIREWPDRIVGTVSCVPEYEEWGGGKSADRDPVQVDGRIWIKVK